MAIAMVGVLETAGFAAAQGGITVDRSDRFFLDVPVNRGVVATVDEPFTELSIANPNIADISTLSARSVYVLGKAAGRTSLTVIGEEGRVISNIEVRVSPDIAEFKERLSEILPGERIEVRTANDGIVLSGTVSGARTVSRAMELAEMYAPGKVTNIMMVSGTHQVMLKVRFAEMERSVAKGLGSQLGIDVEGSDGFGSLVSTPGLPGSAAAFGSLGIGITAGDLAINLLIEALEERGMVRTLAEPNLVAVSGEEAQFLAGGEYPVPVAQEGDTVTIEFKPFGVELGFTPTVVSGDLINLKLRTAVSAIDTSNRIIANGLAVDAFRVRNAETTIEMQDGQSFAIAGLLQDEFDGDINQLPWLGDVPIIGALFRSSAYRRRQSELVVIVTAHLVSPTNGNVLSSVHERSALPSEADFFLRGRLDGGQASEVTSQGFQGDHGYVFD